MHWDSSYTSYFVAFLGVDIPAIRASRVCKMLLYQSLYSTSRYESYLTSHQVHKCTMQLAFLSERVLGSIERFFYILCSLFSP